MNPCQLKHRTKIQESSHVWNMSLVSDSHVPKNARKKISHSKTTNTTTKTLNVWQTINSSPSHGVQNSIFSTVLVCLSIRYWWKPMAEHVNKRGKIIIISAVVLHLKTNQPQKLVYEIGAQQRDTTQNHTHECYRSRNYYYFFFASYLVLT